MRIQILCVTSLLLAACPSEPAQPEPEPTPAPEPADPGLQDDAWGDAWNEASLLPDDGIVSGVLPRNDRDCFTFKVGENGWLAADVAPIDDVCPPVQLSLHGPGGAMLATGSPGEIGGCSPIDPIRDVGARWAPAGLWAVCVAPFHVGAEVEAYTLTVTEGEDSCALEGVPYTSDADGDGDGLPAVCDADDDGDGVDDVDDNCPDVPNSGAATPLFVDDEGYIRQWLLAGPIPDLPSESSCMPSDTEVLGDDAAAAPALGDPAGDTAFFAYFSPGQRINYLRVMAGPTPREVYNAVYVRSDVARDVTLAIGADDGIRVWLNGDEVMEIGSCQGTNRDQFTAEVSLLAGWNRLVAEVRDQGGGWGLFARFKDGDDPITDLELSLDPAGPWAPDQSDLDGDGQGDVCDETPNGD